MSQDKLRYPIGLFEEPAVVSSAQIEIWIEEIAGLPAALRGVIRRMTAEQLETPYRPEGWSVRQVVHHLADSHMNSLVRFKLALTEDRPTIKPYFEDRWAALADYDVVPIETSLRFIELLHERWVCLLRNLREADLQREFFHPESGLVRLDMNIGIYSWHGRHHLAHITGLVEREGWAC